MILLMRDTNKNAKINILLKFFGVSACYLNNTDTKNLKKLFFKKLKD